MKRFLSVSCFALLVVFVMGCPSEPKTPGGTGPGGTPPVATPAWKAKSFIRAADQGCAQVWGCDCSAVAARPGCHTEATPDDRTSGVCAADSGPANGCTRCMALPPAVTCACKDVCP